MCRANADDAGVMKPHHEGDSSPRRLIGGEGVDSVESADTTVDSVESVDPVE